MIRSDNLCLEGLWSEKIKLLPDLSLDFSQMSGPEEVSDGGKDINFPVRNS